MLAEFLKGGITAEGGCATRVYWNHKCCYLRSRGTAVQGDDRCLPDFHMCQQSRLDLSRLDAEPADLHLLVSPAQKLQCAIAPPTDFIAGPIHTRARLKNESIGHEFFCRECGAVQISTRQSCATDAQFSSDSNGNGLTIGIQHIDSSIRNRPSNRDTTMARLRRA